MLNITHKKIAIKLLLNVIDRIPAGCSAINLLLKMPAINLLLIAN